MVARVPTGSQAAPGWPATSVFPSRERWLLAATLAAVVGLAVYRLDTVPAPWFDEGWYLQVPRNLVAFGQYATQSAEGFRHDDTVLSVSPTLYFPIALTFKLWGIGVVPARLVAVAYLVAALLGCYLLARRMFGPAVAAAAAYLFLFRMESDTFTSTFYLGRQVMGEVPAIAFILWACLCFHRAVAERRLGLAVMAGVLAGLATVTKLQYVLIVPPAIAVVGLWGWLHKQREEAWLAAIVAATSLATLGGWFGVLWMLVGSGHMSALLTNLAAASAPQVRVVAVDAVVRAVAFLLGSGFLVVGVPALGYGLVRERQGEYGGAGGRLLLALVVVALGWFSLRSIGWGRYSYPALALANLLIAKLLVDLAAVARQRSSPAGAAIVAVLLLLPVPGFLPIAKRLVGPTDRSVADLQHWIDRELPPGVIVETWEFEVAVPDLKRRYRFPPVRTVDRMIARVNLASTAPAVDYDFSANRPDYLVIGRFGKWTQLYPPAVVDTLPKLATFGEYDVYKVGPERR